MTRICNDLGGHEEDESCYKVKREAVLQTILVEVRVKKLFCKSHYIQGINCRLYEL